MSSENKEPASMERMRCGNKLSVFWMFPSGLFEARVVLCLDLSSVFELELGNSLVVLFLLKVKLRSEEAGATQLERMVVR